MKNDFTAKGRSISDLKVHLVLTAKYRKQALMSEMLKRLHEILEDLLGKWDCKLIEFNGEEDHILFQYHPDVALSNLVNNVKSVTSRKIRREFAEHISSIQWKDVFWNGSYFVASCGGVTVSTLRKYIENQDSPVEQHESLFVSSSVPSLATRLHWSDTAPQLTRILLVTSAKSSRCEAPAAIAEEYRDDTTIQRYRVIRLWE